MSLLEQALKLENGITTHSNCLGASKDQAKLISFLKSIPPERVGLDGRYDHSGLAKRVSLAIRENFSLCDIQNLYVTQRGRVVLLKGKVPNEQILSKLVSLAMTINGATDVETNGVSFEKL